MSKPLYELQEELIELVYKQTLEYQIALVEEESDLCDILRNRFDCYDESELLEEIEELKAVLKRDKERKKKRMLNVENKIFKAIKNNASGYAEDSTIRKTAKHIANYVINQ